MNRPEDRLRPRPAERFAGTEHALDLPAALRALRAEGRPATNGHRQITLVHHGPVRLVLFAFEAGGRLPEHRAPGWLTVHVLRGAVRVRTPDAHHTLAAGHLLALAPEVPYGVDAAEQADMLLGIYPTGPANAAAVMPNEV